MGRSYAVVGMLGLVAVFLVGAALLAADQVHATAAPSACVLLVPSDIQGAFGGSVGQGDLTSAPDGSESICQWTVTLANGRNGFEVQLDVKASFSNKMFQQQRRIASGSTKKVTNVGDSAFFERAKLSGQTYDDLWVHAGDVAFRLEALKKVGPGPLVMLARTILPRLAGGGG